MIRAVAISLVFAGAAIAQQAGARDCALCHTSWVESFKKPNAVLLMPKPPDAQVASQENCLGCHDGAVDDSRRRVWVEHGHRTGVAPPADMNVPGQLPLVDGAIDCRTCHSAHAGLGPETLANTIFVRVPNDRSQLCTMCHTQSLEGPQHGEHPLGRMPHPVPKELLVAGAHYGAEQNEVTCQSCHTPHGAAETDLLALSPKSDRLCLSCHEELTPNLWRSADQADHPLSPRIEQPAQRDAIESWHTIVGHDDTLVCLSCHKMHGPRMERHLLASTMNESGMCVSCHPGYDNLFGSRHDLRTSAPQERNQQDLTADQSGPCGACHSFHHFARQRSARPADPAGVCGTCHSAGECAAPAGGLSFPHPVAAARALPANNELPLYQAGSADSAQITCLTCHDPHDVKHTQFLRSDRDSLCASCHATQADSLAGAHDFQNHPIRTTHGSGGPDVKNAFAETPSQSGKCGFCHNVHDGQGPALWAATTDAPTTADGLCTSCHKAGGMANDAVVRPVIHPHGPDMLGTSVTTSTSPLYDSSGRRSGQGFIACGSCHDPHANSTTTAAMLRGAAHGPAYTLCIDCHQDTSTIAITMHAPDVLAAHAAAAQHAPGAASCGPCHAVHDHADGASLMPKRVATSGWPASAGSCLGCHGPQGSATRVHARVHPPFAMTTGSAAGDLPLFDRTGEQSVSGSISCQTCHLPHGATDLTSLPPIDATTLTAAQISGLKTMLRPYTAPNVCSSCHGFEGLYRYLHYHDPNEFAAAAPSPR